MTRTAVRTWLLDYAWFGTPDQREAEVDCILAQGQWEHLDAVTEKYAGQAEEPGPAAVTEAQGFVLSALYECHDGPHQATCPQNDLRPI